jgi:hypothetical protein
VIETGENIAPFIESVAALVSEFETANNALLL